MAGIYLHIPFCKSRCIYCDFFSSTALTLREQYVEALKEEIALRNNYLSDREISSIYFGGGTPSLLTTKQISEIIEHIRKHYKLTHACEITIEANPSDVTLSYLRHLRQIGVNRLSIGIQTFNDTLLTFLRRRHDATTAQSAIENAKNAGFDNISIDLIYGIPCQTLQMLDDDLSKAIDANVQHISTYCLTYEEGTLLTRQLKQNKFQAIDEDTLNDMADLIERSLCDKQYVHYEVSNYCLPDYHSRHNLAYWTDKQYLGLGAGAHSYDNKSRQWNICDIEKYINAVQARNLSYQKEVLTDIDKYNETIMLALRTQQGLELKRLDESDRTYLIDKSRHFITQELLQTDGNYLHATAKGLKILDYITCQLMKSE
ncbi:MAG: radical SAM family heme chaperone HemW [Paludibacteraceae bacterium]|nr:radical SAM family heme chaperone HemW [Paludibacteraceae bacterium]